MDDLVRSKEKSSPEKEERQLEFELEKQSAKFKKSILGNNQAFFGYVIWVNG